MKVTALVATTLFGAAMLGAAGLLSQAPADATTIRLFLIERPVGIELVTVATTPQGRTMTSEVNVTERRTPLTLKASLTVAGNGSPVHFRAQGRSYRFVNVDAEVSFARTTARVSSMGSTSEVTHGGPAFPARSWAPVAARAWLIDYWEKSGRPAAIALLPGDADSVIRISHRGTDALKIGAGVVRLRRYSVDGVVWGRETVWVDADGAFAALVSRIHILPLEAVREDLISALPALQEISVADRVADLSAFRKEAQPVAAGSFALAGARVISLDGTEPLNDGVVVVRGGLVSAVGPRGATRIPSGIPVIDVAGKTIIPGLWDMHAHASQIEWAPAYLAAGVTTIRDMGGETRFLTAMRDAIAADRALGPRVELAGLVDGPGDGGFGTVVAADEAEGRSIVNRYHERGFRQMKLYSLLPAPVASAIISRAHELKMTVTGHVPTAMGLEAAVTAGLDHVAHQPNVGQAGSPERDRLIGLLASKGTVVDPTQAWGELLGGRDPQSEPGLDLAPFALAANYRSVTTNPGGGRGAAQGPAAPPLLKLLHERGIPIVAGTDGAVPGHSLLRELELYVRAGLTPTDAIRSATVVPARAMGLSEISGRIAVGLRADLVVLDADPTVDISAIRKTRYVVANGRVFAPDPLWKLAGFRIVR